MKYTIVLQHDETDCGVACIASIAKYYGKTISFTKIRTLAGTDLMGTSGLGIVRSAIALGFFCKGIVSKEKHLPNELPVPCIAHIKQDYVDHYVVVYKINKDAIVIADPARGIKRIKIDTFKEKWSGVLFLIEPEAKYFSARESSSFFNNILQLLKPYKIYVIEIIIASVLLSFIGVTSSFYFRFLIDEVLSSGLRITLATMSIGYLCLIIFQAFLSISRNQIIMHISNKIDAVLIFEYLFHVFHLPMDFFGKRKVGEIVSRLNDVEIIRNAISMTTMSVVIDSIMLILGTLVLFAFGSSLAIIAIFSVVLSTIVSWIFAKQYKRKIKEKARIDAEKQSSIVESINGITTIKALGTEDVAFQKIESQIVESINKGIKLGTMSNIQNQIQVLISQVGTLSIYWIGSLAILDGKLSLGQLISFNMILSYFLGPLARLLSLQPNLQEAIVSVERFSEILEFPTEEQSKGDITLNTIQGAIEIRNLNFTYGTRGYNLQNINLSINAGEKIAIVGPSGSGKSTLTKLIMKFYKIEDGSITIDGYNINDIDTYSLRSLIGYVPQEILLFSGTIAENIAWGAGNTTLKDIISAAIAANAHEFINNLPDRYFTKVGERGATLSGGERQRIALARVLLRKPKLLILDEATSSLDSISEKIIMSAVDRLAEGITTIIVAHRLSTVKHCDKIFVINNGKIIESGCHEDLIMKNSIYKNLWIAQEGEKSL